MPDRADEHFNRLPARYRVLVVEDHGRHGGDTAGCPELLGFADLCGVLAAFEDGLSTQTVQADLLRYVCQGLVAGRIFQVTEIGFEQRLLQCVLLALLFGPVQQAMSIERVVDTSLALGKGEAQLGTALTNRLVNAFDLFWRRAIFFGDVLFDVLPFGRHVRVQLERLEVDVRLHFIPQRLQRLIQRAQADDTPGAGNIGDEIDLQCSRHIGPFQSADSISKGHTIHLCQYLTTGQALQLGKAATVFMLGFQVRQHSPEQRCLEGFLKTVSQPRNQAQLAALNVRGHMHTMHDRQQWISRAMHDQHRQAQTVQQLHPARLGQNRHDLTLDALGIEGPVVGHRSLMQQLLAIILDLRAAQRCKQIGLLLDGHFPVGCAAPRQQLHQRRTGHRQALRTGAGHDQRQAFDPRRGQIGQVLGNHAAHARAKNVKLANLQGVHQAQGIIGHIGQRIRRRDRQAQLVAQHFKGQVGLGWLLHPGRQTDVAIVVANHPVALLTQRNHNLVRPMNQLPAKAHYQQQGRVGLTADALIGNSYLFKVSMLYRNIDITTIGRKRRQAAQKRGQKN
ncbi:hypothetical protein ALP66_05728 [Pseudomonas amygdali pv. photiniae]|uniref:Uncharacterized protein n=1 Tax=Pseudomonas amygdali pv. photiniae TaxID=251724 RepID=A0A0P9U2Z9_PSEA0|nr:Unknown protein sequence [Pseudomonas amygdali pv. photiniae]RMS39727.1 hypothetical protein ALP66_05728 [Pseudomonas amygdali pv. photiniae]